MFSALGERFVSHLNEQVNESLMGLRLVLKLLGVVTSSKAAFSFHGVEMGRCNILAPLPGLPLSVPKLREHRPRGQ